VDFVENRQQFSTQAAAWSDKSLKELLLGLRLGLLGLGLRLELGLVPSLPRKKISWLHLSGWYFTEGCSQSLAHCFKVEYYKYTDHTDKYFLGLFGVGGLYFFLSCSVGGPPISGSTLDLLRELYFPNNYFCCPISEKNGLIQIYGNQYFDLPYSIL
jgi:hypothetical protein